MEVPDAATPIAVLLFDQLIDPPEGVVVKLVAGTVLPEQAVLLETAVTTGVAGTVKT